MPDTFLGCGMMDLLLGHVSLVTGLADEPDGGLRVYVGPRYNKVFVIVDEPEIQAAIRRAWVGFGKVFVPRPPDDALMSEVEDA